MKKNIKRAISWLVSCYYFFRETVSPSKIQTGKDIPIIINNFNRLTSLQQLLDALTIRGYTNIYILDNASTYPPLLDYYDTCPFPVLRLSENLGFKALWKSPLRKRFCRDYYIYTDSDVVPVKECPNDFIDYFLRELKRHPLARKIGFSLRIDNLPDCYAHKDKVPSSWIRKQTLVNAERYITPELKEYEEKILGAEEKIYVLESRLYGELVSAIQQNIAVIQSNCRVIARLDVLSGFSDLALSNRYCRPEMNDGYAIDIKAGRHPVIETLMPRGEEFVANDVYLDNKTRQIIILTGPNMAGKSALLRQTALIVLLAQIGSFVPADSARIGYCDKLFTRVGASDNISRGESTFMVEMLETSMILHNLSSRSLVLLDEIGRGTSTYDGMSIARAIVEYIHEYGDGAKTLFATHYHELNDLESIYPRVKNYHIAVKEVDKKVIFLRKLKEGGVAHSFGLHVARMAGMPHQVIESAERTLEALEKGGDGKAKVLPSKRIKPHNVKEGRIEGDGSLQLSFFQLEDPLLMSLRDELNSADLDNMTPMQAFDLLRNMKSQMKG